MFAVVNASGKQYRAGEGDELVIDRVRGEVGEAVEFPVSFTADGENFDFGDGRTARAEIVEHFRGEKVQIYKYRPKNNYKKKTGHRQELSRVRITGLTGFGG